MVTMELSEIINPHFAIPVAAVIVCAFLVLAFGFKSPVQPPSFDFEHEERRSKKNKKKQKTVSNGHAGSAESKASKVIVKQPSSSAKQSSRPTNNKESKVEASKVKTKKSANTAAATVSRAAKVASPKVITETAVEDSGEWTMAPIRKVKAKKEQPQRVTVNQNFQKEVKEENWGEEENWGDDDDTPVVVAPPVIAFSQVKGQDKKDKEKETIKEDSSDKENLQPEITEEIVPAKSASSKKKKAKKPIVEATPEPEFIISEPEIVPVVEAVPVVEPVPVIEPVPEPVSEPVPESSAPDSGASSHSSDSTQDWVMIDRTDITQNTEAEPVVQSESLFPKMETKLETTPKRNKKKRHQVKEVPVEPAAVELAPPSEPAAPEGDDKNTPSEETTILSSGNAELETDNKPPVIFDELGAESWVEAKPVKKSKKKPRRDN